MKKTNTLYWVFTGLLCLMMVMASIPDLLMTPQAMGGFAHLGYPVYLLPFLGVARVLGVIAILVPGRPRLKEWAYAGFTFDLVGAIYSGLANHDPVYMASLAVFGLILIFLSYRFHHKRMKARMMA